ncbi:MAG: hypothetical protein KGY40_00505 [Thioalkalivibrio sp.]|nr:hypothetical protein [Thioalkalivibrio sp.]
MIVSSVNGRVRVRAQVLRSAGTAAAMVSQLSAVPGVIDARPNAGAGCIAVTFDPDVLEIEVLEKRIESLCRSAERARRNPGRGITRHLNRATKYGMVASLATSLAYGYVGRKKPHIRFGTAFLVFAGAHMLRYRHTLMR